MIKTIDKLLVKSFIPPFAVAFFIGLFVFIMQFLWLYIDDIIGKGASLFLILELVFYLSLSFVPMALPIGVLLASVMLFGNLSERYELSSLKTAGVSLMRIMAPVMLFCVGISFFSFICSNYLIPISKLKYYSRLHDIRRQKPTLSIEEGVFNRDFQGYVIRVGEKGSDNKSIKDILIYDHVTAKGDETNIIVAKSGEMYPVENENVFVMNLYDGIQYQDVKKGGGIKKSQYPFIQTHFEKWTKVFDLGEFEMDRTNEDDFKSHQYMMSVAQLSDTIVGLNRKIDDTKLVRNHNYANLLEIEIRESNTRLQDTNKDRRKSNYNPQSTAGIKRKKDPLTQINELDLSTEFAFLNTFDSISRRKLIGRGRSYTKRTRETAKNASFRLENYNVSKSKYIYELHWKYCQAAVCFIFLFIGAPMGAIIRKGGYGYPLLVSIVFFIIFIMLSTACRKFAHSLRMDAILAGWLPGIILFPIGLLLTYRAMKDRKFLDVDGLITKLAGIFNRKSKT